MYKWMDVEMKTTFLPVKTFCNSCIVKSALNCKELLNAFSNLGEKNYSFAIMFLLNSSLNAKIICCVFFALNVFSMYKKGVLFIYLNNSILQKRSKSLPRRFFQISKYCQIGRILIFLKIYFVLFQN